MYFNGGVLLKSPVNVSPVCLCSKRAPSPRRLVTADVCTEKLSVQKYLQTTEHLRENKLDRPVRPALLEHHITIIHSNRQRIRTRARSGHEHIKTHVMLLFFLKHKVLDVNFLLLYLNECLIWAFSNLPTPLWFRFG